jgi:hypothetical protein
MSIVLAIFVDVFLVFPNFLCFQNDDNILHLIMEMNPKDEARGDDTSTIFVFLHTSTTFEVCTL